MRAAVIIASLSLVVSLLACSAPSPTPLTLSPDTLPAGSRGVPFSLQLGSDGQAPVSFTLAAGELPTGMVLTAEGLLSGTPLTALTARFTVGATDAAGRRGSREYELVIDPPNITVSPARLPNAVRGATYLAQLSAAGGDNGYQFSLVGGALPAGLSLSLLGAIGGRPTTVGTSVFTVRATDGTGRSGTNDVSLTVVEPMITVLPTELPEGTVGLDYEEPLSPGGGADPYTFSLESGALPDGVSLTPGGVVLGRPTTAGTSAFTVRVTDANAVSGTFMFMLTIAAPAIVISPATLPRLTVGVPFSQQLTAAGGTPPYTFGIAIGVLPPGITLTPAGLLSGTPAGIITTTLTVSVSDSGGLSSARSYTVDVEAAALSLSPTALPSGVVAVPYSQQLTADGGTSPYFFTLASGALPAGLSLSSVGTLSGTPTVAQTSSFSVRAADTLSSSVTVPYTLTITATAVVIDLAPTTLSPATVGGAYTSQLSASGGTAPYVFLVASGTLPAGLTLGADGLLSGTPSAPAMGSFTVLARDAAGATGQRGYVLDVQ